MLGLMALLLPPDLVFPFRMPARERYARGASISARRTSIQNKTVQHHPFDILCYMCRRY